MTQSGPKTTPSDKLLAAPGVKLRLALFSGLILAVGALLAPGAAPTPPALSTPQERVAPLLEEQVQLQQAAPPFRGVQDVALRVRQHSVAIGPASQGPRTVDDFSETRAGSRPSGFGAFISDTQIMTHAGALEGRTSVHVSTADGVQLEASLVSYEPSTGIALLQTSTSGRPATLAREAPEVGSLAVAAGRWDARDMAVPVFVTSVGEGRYGVAATGGTVPPGMPLYTLDGELFAVAAGPDRAGDAFPAEAAASRLKANAEVNQRRASFGLAFQDLTGPLARALGEGGVLVSDVVDEGPAAQAGIQPGDVLLAVGEVAVDSTAAAMEVLSAAQVATSTAMRLGRSGRVRTVPVTPTSAYAVSALARRPRDRSGPEARDLFPAPQLDRADIPSAAQVLSVNGRRVSTRAQTTQTVRRSQPTIVLLRHNENQFFAVIEPTP